MGQVNIMNTTNQTEAFEEVLLSYTELCYSVALRLTRDPDRAQGLARYTLAWAWQERNKADGTIDIKQKLLQSMRERFLHEYSRNAGQLVHEEDYLEHAPGDGQHAQPRSTSAPSGARLR